MILFTRNVIGFSITVFVAFFIHQYTMHYLLKEEYKRKITMFDNIGGAHS